MNVNNIHMEITGYSMQWMTELKSVVASYNVVLIMTVVYSRTQCRHTGEDANHWLSQR